MLLIAGCGRLGAISSGHSPVFVSAPSTASSTDETSSFAYVSFSYRALVGDSEGQPLSNVKIACTNIDASHSAPIEPFEHVIDTWLLAVPAGNYSCTTAAPGHYTLRYEVLVSTTDAARSISIAQNFYLLPLHHGLRVFVLWQMRERYVHVEPRLNVIFPDGIFTDSPDLPLLPSLSSSARINTKPRVASSHGSESTKPTHGKEKIEEQNQSRLSELDANASISTGPKHIYGRGNPQPYLHYTHSVAGFGADVLSISNPAPGLHRLAVELTQGSFADADLTIYVVGGMDEDHGIKAMQTSVKSSSFFWHFADLHVTVLGNRCVQSTLYPVNYYSTTYGGFKDAQKVGKSESKDVNFECEFVDSFSAHDCVTPVFDYDDLPRTCSVWGQSRVLNVERELVHFNLTGISSPSVITLLSNTYFTLQATLVNGDSAITEGSEPLLDIYDVTLNMHTACNPFSWSLYSLSPDPENYDTAGNYRLRLDEKTREYKIDALRLSLSVHAQLISDGDSPLSLRRLLGFTVSLPKELVDSSSGLCTASPPDTQVAEDGSWEYDEYGSEEMLPTEPQDGHEEGEYPSHISAEDPIVPVPVDEAKCKFVTGMAAASAWHAICIQDLKRKSDSEFSELTAAIASFDHNYNANTYVFTTDLLSQPKKLIEAKSEEENEARKDQGKQGQKTTTKFAAKAQRNILSWESSSATPSQASAAMPSPATSTFSPDNLIDLSDGDRSSPTPAETAIVKELELAEFSRM